MRWRTRSHWPDFSSASTMKVMKTRHCSSEEKAEKPTAHAQNTLTNSGAANSWACDSMWNDYWDEWAVDGLQTGHVTAVCFVSLWWISFQQTQMQIRKLLLKPDRFKMMASERTQKHGDRVRTTVVPESEGRGPSVVEMIVAWYNTGWGGLGCIPPRQTPISYPITEPLHSNPGPDR